MDQQPAPYAQNVPPAAMPPARPAQQRQARRVAAGFGIALLALVLIFAAAAFAWVRTEPTIPAMLPADVALAGSTDLSWWWNAAAPLRRLPDVQKQLIELQKEQQISIQDDILPWAGQGGAAVLSYDQQKPQMAVFVQVRDWLAFARFLKRMEARPESKKLGSVASKQARTSTYDGVTIATQTIDDGSVNPPVLQTAMLHGWYVVGIGAGALEKILDVYTGKAASLSASSAWLTAQRHLPQTTVGWSAFRFDRFRSMMSSMTAASAPSAQADALKQLDYLTVTNFTAPGTALRWDAVSIPTTPKMQQLLQQFSAAQTAKITPAALSSLPSDTVATFITSNAPKQASNLMDWSSALEKSFAPSTQLAQSKAQLAKFSGLTGLSAVNIVVQPNGAGGATAFADADTPQAAGKVEAIITRQWGATPLGKMVNRAVPQITSNFAATVKPTTTLQGNRVQLATSAGLLAPSLPTGAPYLAFPAEASGASWYVGGNFRFLAPLRKLINNPQFAGGSDPQNRTAANEVVSDLALDNAQWASWARTDPSGQWQQQTTVVTNWDWRAAENRLVDSTIKWEPHGGAPMTLPGMPKGLPYSVGVSKV